MRISITESIRIAKFDNVALNDNAYSNLSALR
jgi:hypothetical protein